MSFNGTIDGQGHSIYGLYYSGDMVYAGLFGQCSGTVKNLNIGSGKITVSNPNGQAAYAGGICGTNEGGSLSGNTSAAICGSGSDAVLPETASEQ